MSWRVGVGHFETTDLMRGYVNKVLNSGRLSYGPMSKKLEADFAAMHGCKYGVVSNSGTSSLQVALQAMKEYYGWPNGAEVIVPALTFVATVNVVLHNNLKPVLVDVNPLNYNIDSSLVKSAITKNTVCVMPVHLFGQPAPMRAILQIVPPRVKFLEDACETMLATHHGKMVGSMGDVGCFSFYIAHILTAGVGGMATTNNEELADLMRSLVNHGRNITAGGDLDIRPSDDVRRARFQFERVGHSYRITELEAALALAQLNDLKHNIIVRQDHARQLTDGLRKWEQLSLPIISHGNSHSFMMYPILCPDKWRLCGWLESNGVETREMLPLTNQPVYKSIFNEDDYPVAKMINEHGFYIGCHPGMSNGDINYIVELFDQFFRGGAA